MVRSLPWWVWPAVAVRLVLMGVGCHPDLYSVYWRAHLLAYHGQAIEHNQLLVHLLHAGWLVLWRPTGLLPHDLWPYPAEDDNGWLSLVQRPDASLVLLILKLPYVMAELASGAVLCQVLPRASRRRVLAYWLWNPFLLYGVSLYGRYESLPVLLVCLSFLALVREKRVLAWLACVGATLTRFWPALLLPVHWWLAPTGRQRRLMLAWGAIPLGVVLAVQALTASSLPRFRDSAELASLLTMPHRVFLFAAYIPLLQADVIYLFPLALVLIYLAVTETPRGPAHHVWRWCAAVIYVLFATTYFHPQWLAWTAPFLALQFSVRPRVGVLTAVMALCMVFYTFQFGKDASVFLFCRLAPGAFQTWPHPMELLDKVRLGGVMVGTMRTILSAILLFLAWHARHDAPLGR